MGKMLGMIDILKAGCQADGFQPVTDSHAAIVLFPGEQVEAEFFPSAIQCMLFPRLDNLQEFAPMINPANDPASYHWKVQFTDRRMLVWSPMSHNLLGKIRQKSGVALGGQICYEWIEYIGLEGAYKVRMPFRLPESKWQGPAMMEVTITLSNGDQAGLFVRHLLDHVLQYQQSAGADMARIEEALQPVRSFVWSGREGDEADIDFSENGGRSVAVPR